MLIEPLGKLLDKQIDPLLDEIGNITLEILKLQRVNNQLKQLEEDDGKIKKSQDTIDVLKDMMQDIRGYLGDESG